MGRSLSLLLRYARVDVEGTDRIVFSHRSLTCKNVYDAIKDRYIIRHGAAVCHPHPPTIKLSMKMCSLLFVRNKNSVRHWD